MNRQEALDCVLVACADRLTPELGEALGVIEALVKAADPIPIYMVELTPTCDGGECDDESEWLIWDTEGQAWLPVCQMHRDLHEGATQ